ncbi:MAG: cysteine-rich small domain-containing protein [Candidatus Pacearchaeota archaeon]
MDTRDKAKKLIELRIRNLVGEFDFDRRKKEFPNECPCYTENRKFSVSFKTGNFEDKENKRCHDIPENELNCFLCYCPEYNLNLEFGGCKIGNPQEKGKWFYHEALPRGKIWDCSDCGYPHDKKVAEKYLRKMFGLDK